MQLQVISKVKLLCPQELAEIAVLRLPPSGCSIKYPPLVNPQQPVMLQNSSPCLPLAAFKVSTRPCSQPAAHVAPIIGSSQL